MWHRTKNINEKEWERELRGEHCSFNLCFFGTKCSGISHRVRFGQTLAQYWVASRFVETAPHANHRTLYNCAFRLFTGLIRRANLMRSSTTRRCSHQWSRVCSYREYCDRVSKTKRIFAVQLTAIYETDGPSEYTPHTSQKTEKKIVGEYRTLLY